MRDRDVPSLRSQIDKALFVGPFGDDRRVSKRTDDYWHSGGISLRLVMTDPRSQALYVMQNEVGLIKIGRALDPSARRQTLVQEERCAIEIVAVLPGWGDREEATHIALRDHAIEGEWFVGSNQARAAMAALLPGLSHRKWPYVYDAEQAGVWLDSFYDRRDRRSIKKQFRRILTVHLLQNEPGPDADASLQLLIGLTATGSLPSVAYQGGQAIYWTAGSSRPIPVPPYSTDPALALSLWPEKARPAVWDGSAYDCCVAAMRARLAGL